MSINNNKNDTKIKAIMAQRKFKVKFVDGKACVEKKQLAGGLNESKCESKGMIERDGSSVKFIPDSIDQSFDTFFQSFVDKITGLRLTQKDTGLIFSLSEELLKESISMCRRFFGKENVSSDMFTDVLSTTECYASKKISTVKTAYLRKKS